MIAIRAAKCAMVAAVALFASLVAFGNITDYGTNFAFVQHVLLMDTIFPFSSIGYRAVAAPTLHHAAYALIIATEIAIAVLCWGGAALMLRRIRAQAEVFNGAKSVAVLGLLLGFLLWQVGFVTIGGEWFGTWMSDRWNGAPSAFRFVTTIVLILIFVAMPDTDPLAGKRSPKGP